MYLASEVIPKLDANPPQSAASCALDELDKIYAFLYARVGNRPDAEDLTHEVALKALPRLRDGAPQPAIRAYLYATARSVLAVFWSRRLAIRESELTDQISEPSVRSGPEPSAESAAAVARILDRLSPHHRQVLELRFLRGYSVKDIARETGRSIGSVKVMQLRALRRAAAVQPA